VTHARDLFIQALMDYGDKHTHVTPYPTKPVELKVRPGMPSFGVRARVRSRNDKGEITGVEIDGFDFIRGTDITIPA